jgi:DNA-binding PadR family transcriptional regulator
LSRFASGFLDGDDLGGRAFGLGRKLASGDLRLLILAMLGERPRHGYEIIKALDERSKGFYVPSPGMVYPALAYLEEIGHATVEAVGARKRHSITETGRVHLTEKRAPADALLAQFERVGERVERLRRALAVAKDQESTGEFGHRGSRHMRARRDLKRALDADRDSSPEEVQRITEILERATAAILGNRSD